MARGHRCSAVPHEFCGGCKLVLPSRVFSSLEHNKTDEARRCNTCLGSTQCAMCQRRLSVSRFSLNQRSRGPGGQKCQDCVAQSATGYQSALSRGQRLQGPAQIPADRPIQTVSLSTSSQNRWLRRAKPADIGGAESYWNWAVVVAHALLPLPSEVLPTLFRCLDVGSGVAAVGDSVAACAVCGTSWSLNVRTLSSHRCSAAHRARLEAWRQTIATIDECKAAAQEAGITTLSNPSLEASSVAAAAAASSQPGRRWVRR
eukprot:TRINITY_DN83422_c0_g1_i1.p1 TRINITY_DN83422_c0_g1~~TRINITY_DN83422_c0_g1_i1.p1  ORF type:complete len:259 (-),score=26.53 TRINITY_DN83422_c0_g1_i1:967-1743(-)